MRVVISTERLNCYGTWVKTDGIDLTQYKRNPILLWMHQRGCAIGTVGDLKVEGNRLTGELMFDEVREESRIAKAQMEAGTLKMVSPGFDVLEMSDRKELVKPGQKFKTVIRSRLNEVSVVDVGGNDDSMVLCYEGETLELMAGGGCALPELPNDNAQNRVQMNEILLALGLTAEATTAEAIREITLLRGAKSQGEALKQELETLKLAGITTQVDAAIAAGKITSDKKPQFMELGKKLGGGELQSVFDAMQSVVRPMDLIAQGGGAVGNYKTLSDVPAAEFELLRKNSPEVYATLYKAEFGCECPDLRSAMEV